MEHTSRHSLCGLAAALLANLLAIGAVNAQPSPETGTSGRDVPQQHRVHPSRTEERRLSPLAPLRIDRTGRPRVGIASYYANFFAGRKMANGARMDPRGNNAASRTLPLGTVARVTNLSTHRSAIVRIEDRGPYVEGRIVDLSPSTAHQLGITRRAGIARVRVTPLRVPLQGEDIRLASASSPQLR